VTIARIIVNLSLDRTFDYRIPPSLRGRVRIGSRVTVPFGKGGERHGYVIGLTNKSEFPDLKKISALDGDKALIPAKLMKLGEWMADYYCCSREAATMAMLPAVVRKAKMGKKTRKSVRLADEVDAALALEELGKRAPKQAELIKLLVRQHSCTQSFLTQGAGIPASAIKGLEKKGVVVVEDEVEERDPFASVTILPTLPLELTDEQATAMDAIHKSLDAKRRDIFLLNGVTGSGKTEVYLQAIALCMERGESAIVLVPEIALTPQTMERFRGRFGNSVSVLHSRLSDGERFDEWTKISEGKVNIVVGARSALFAPFENVGLIVVDEEHEPSYKQDRNPRYSARDIAVVRGKMENAAVILGTATPSLESMYNCELGKYKRLDLTQRVDDQEMPAMEAVDMAAEAATAGQPQVLSRRLISAMRNALEEGEQIMIFLNRRGYATQMQCLQCGYVADCDDCSVSFTYHRKAGHLMCHLCGEVRHAPEKCPECGDPQIRFSGMGTQKIESMIRAVLPNARVMRMDADTMTGKHAYREALTAFRAGQVDILVGTQMIAKGLHFPNVTLVGVVFADLSLNLPDFRAGERTFQLIVQVAGRAGRGELPGRVIVQTYTPYNPIIQASLKQDYEAFYETEIQMRRDLGFPPVTHAVLVGVRGDSEAVVERVAREFAEFARPALPEGVAANPAVPSPIAKKRGLYHFQILYMGTAIVQLSRVLKRACAQFKRPKDVFISVDVDPLSVL
jgi:primosomal protein N' (replication factor Y)